MPEYKTKALDETMWPDFVRLVEANNGVRGGRWCMWYHRKDRGEWPEARWKAEVRLVREERAHASLVYDGENYVGWCKFGSPEELPCIHNERAYLATNPKLPDWRITWFFPGKGYRGKGVASAALQGAIEQTKKTGRGTHRGSKGLTGISIQRRAGHIRTSWLQAVTADRKTIGFGRGDRK